MPFVSSAPWDVRCGGERSVWDTSSVASGAGYLATQPPALGRCPLQDISNVVARFTGKADAKAPAAYHGLPVAAAAAAVAAPAPLADPFEAEVDGTEEASEYGPAIFNQLFRKEVLSMPLSSYMDSQHEVTPKMRGILIDWLVDVQAKYRMRPETLFLTVNLIDRYLTRVQVSRRRLQLVGVVAMLIAAKFEELEAPLAESLVYITDNAYTRKEIFDLECKFLAAVDFAVLVPTAAHFLDRLQRANKSDTFHQELARYILELGAVEYGMIAYEPSRMAAAALLLSNKLMCRQPAWSPAMARVSRWPQASLETCACELRGLLERAPQRSLQAVRKKYSAEKRYSVATMSFSSV